MRSQLRPLNRVIAWSDIRRSSEPSAGRRYGAISRGPSGAGPGVAGHLPLDEASGLGPGRRHGRRDCTALPGLRGHGRSPGRRRQWQRPEFRVLPAMAMMTQDSATSQRRGRSARECDSNPRGRAGGRLLEGLRHHRRRPSAEATLSLLGHPSRSGVRPWGD
jgi:hypothetical protein